MYRIDEVAAPSRDTDEPTTYLKCAPEIASDREIGSIPSLPSVQRDRVRGVADHTSCDACPFGLSGNTSSMFGLPPTARPGRSESGFLKRPGGASLTH